MSRARPVKDQHDLSVAPERAGARHLAGKYGEDWLFTGPPRAQATPALFGWPNLLPVTGPGPELGSSRLS